MMKCIVIDDEPLARELLEDNISKVPFLRCVKSCSNGLEAMDFLRDEKVDLIFLDIQMPGITGIQFLQSLKKPIMVIFITAYEKFALDGYNLNVIDYLLKPVSFERFLKAVNKADELFQLRARPESSPPVNFIFVHADYNLVRVNLAEIMYIEGLKDYVKIYLTAATRPVITRMSMKSLEDLLPSHQFMRVHKSFIISIDKIVSVRKSRIKIATAEIPLSTNYAEKFFQAIDMPNSSRGTAIQ